MNSGPLGHGSQWCEERLRQPREDLHLARLFTAPEMRRVVTATGAIYIELEAIATGFRDFNVARSKFAWWRDELARLGAHRPAHPATRMLAAGAMPAATTGLLDLVTGMELNLLAGPPGGLADAEAWGERGFAPLAAVLAVQTGAGDGAAYRALGVGIGLARCLLQPSLAAEARANIAAAAHGTLHAERFALPAGPPALRILAALAWRRAIHPTTPAPADRESRRRVFTAWRSARGKLPRGLRDK